MAKNNFKAQEATGDPNYAQKVGTMGQDAMGTGLGQQAEGFSGLKDTLGQQRSFSDMLQSAAAGTGGPTLAEQQLKDATSRNNANAAGFAAGAKGLNPALAARQALMAQSGNNQQAAGQAVQTRMQEQQMARAQLGGALQGQASTAGGMTSAGAGLVGTGGQLANQSNANLNTSRANANQVNADVAKQNSSMINGAIGGVFNAAGGALGLAEGGVVPGEPEGTQSDETSIALAKGGVVPQAPALPSGTHGMPTSRRSFAAQVAHHLSREYFDEGGEAHGSYDFPAMDVSGKKPAKHGSYDFSPMSVDSPEKEPTEGKEGEDSMGKKKPSINRAFGGDVDEGDDYNPATDEDVDQGEDDGKDEDEGGAPQFAEGGDVADESAGMNMSQTPGALVKSAAAAHPTAPVQPSIFQPMADKFNGSMLGKLLNPGSDQAARARGVNVDGAAGAPAAAPAAKRGPLFNFAEGGEEKPLPISPQAAAALEADPEGKKMNPHLANATGRTHGVTKAGPPGGKMLKTSIAVKEPGQQGAVASFDAGGPVPGKANVPGNSLKNDVVDAKLSPGEVVLPRTISHDPEKAKRFVELLMKHGGNGHAALKDIKKRKV